MGEVILGQLLSSTSALFVAPRTPIFPGFSRMVARLFANPRGPVGFQELKNTSFFQAFLVTRDYKMGRSRAERIAPNSSGEPQTTSGKLSAKSLARPGDETIAGFPSITGSSTQSVALSRSKRNRRRLGVCLRKATVRPVRRLLPKTSATPPSLGSLGPRT